MYTRKGFCIYNHENGKYYKGSMKWSDTFDKCKIYSCVGHARNALTQYPSLKPKCSIYTVRLELGDKVEDK